MTRYRKICFSLLFTILSTFAGCKNDAQRLQEFMASPVILPEQAIKIESGNVSVVSLPENSIRLVYCFSEKECYSCLASHVYQLCNLFDSSEFTTILLFCPPEAIYDSTMEQMKAVAYDFPIYFLKKEESEEIKSSLSKLRYRIFLLGEDDLPLSVGDPVRDDEAYIRFRSALDTLRGRGGAGAADDAPGGHLLIAAKIVQMPI